MRVMMGIMLFLRMFLNSSCAGGVPNALAVRTWSRPISSTMTAR